MRQQVWMCSAILLGVLGCAGGPDDMPEIGQVTGTVTVDGAPKSGLIVAFQPEGGRPSVGTTNGEGRYELTYSREAKGAKIGKNLVTISTEVETPEEEPEEEVEEPEEPIPARYNTEAVDNPEMTVEVKPGENTFDWDIVTTGDGSDTGSE